MRLYYTLALLLLLYGCNKPSKFELSIKASSIDNGTILIKQGGEAVFDEAFKNGALNVSRQLESPGYYNITVVDIDKPLNTKVLFDVYLENGSYTITIDPGKPEGYPTIVSTSEKQQELSAYYALADAMAGQANRKVDSLTKLLDYKAGHQLSKADHSALIKNLSKAQIQRREMDPAILSAFIDKYPKNTIGAHLISQQYYASKPAEYQALFKKLTSEVQNSDEGIKINNKLTSLLKLTVGAEAPDIAGHMPDGKPFDKKSIDNKVTLIEFWRSDSKLSRLNHQKMVRGIILTESDRKDFGMISVSIDTDSNSWINAVKEDHTSWPQVSDLKGDSSPNVNNWSITTLPTYFLVDKQWHIIKPNIGFADIDTEVHEYLAKH